MKNNEEKIEDALYEILKMKRVFLWFMQSFIYLMPVAVIVAGFYIFIRFTPGHAALLSMTWVIIVSYAYVKYNRWY